MKLVCLCYNALTRLYPRHKWRGFTLVYMTPDGVIRDKSNIFESSKSIDWEEKLEKQLHRFSGLLIFEKQSIFIQFETEEHLSIFLVTFS